MFSHYKHRCLGRLSSPSHLSLRHTFNTEVRGDHGLLLE